MTAAELVADLRRRRFTLIPDGPRLRVSPGSALTPELRVAIREHKIAILACLKQAQKHPPLSEEERDFLTQHARNRREP